MALRKIINRKSPINNRMTMRVAAIDLGTNTVRLLVAEPDGAGGYRPIFAAQEITRLGQDLLPDRTLQPEPIRRTLVVLRRFRQAAEAHAAGRIVVVGTSALREAKNRDAFLIRARREAGLDVQVISGEEEARLTLLGVRAALRIGRGHLVAMDIGGGSTEFVLADGPDIMGMVSTGLGVVKLTEAHLKSDPPRPHELAAVRETVAARIARLRTLEWPDAFRDAPAQGVTFAGTAGTLTSLAAIDLALDPYDPDRVNGHRLSRERVEALCRELAAQPSAQRRNVRGLEPARADVIVAGTLVCLGAMDGLGFPELTVSDGGLREGILLDLLTRPEARLPSDRAPDGGG
ncbi:MAG: Ppx/GppA phosphatase family protein [Candidatus Methylomirabilota bacterium]